MNNFSMRFLFKWHNGKSSSDKLPLMRDHFIFAPVKWYEDLYINAISKAFILVTNITTRARMASIIRSYRSSSGRYLWLENVKLDQPVLTNALNFWEDEKSLIYSTSHLWDGARWRTKAGQMEEEIVEIIYGGEESEYCYRTELCLWPRTP